jgi:hypothetical protein
MPVRVVNVIPGLAAPHGVRQVTGLHSQISFPYHRERPSLNHLLRKAGDFKELHVTGVITLLTKQGIAPPTETVDISLGTNSSNSYLTRTLSSTLTICQLEHAMHLPITAGTPLGMSLFVRHLLGIRFRDCRLAMLRSVVRGKETCHLSVRLLSLEHLLSTRKPPSDGPFLSLETCDSRSFE